MTDPPFEAPAALYRGTQTEAQFRATVLEAAAYHGWEVLFAIPDAAYRALADLVRGNEGGGSAYQALADLRAWPDVMLGHAAHARSVYVELKTDIGKPTAAQKQKIARLFLAGVDVRVWRPTRDFDDEIIPTLQGQWVGPNAETVLIATGAGRGEGVAAGRAIATKRRALSGAGEGRV